MRHRIKMDPKLREMLELSKVEWELEAGSKHTKLRVAGKLVLVLPATGSETGCMAKNARAALRRHLRQQHGVEV